MQEIIEDKELGRLVVRVNPRARRLVFRTKSDAIYVSVPPGCTEKDLRASIEKLRPKLLGFRQAVERPLIDLNYKIDKEYFKLSLVKGTQSRFLARSEFGKTEIICPPDANFADEALQQWLRKVIEEALRRNAKAVLPVRLHTFSVMHKLPYRSVKINSSRGRWGSCSTSKNINLSYFLLLLPLHLMEYVMLHELCHTLEMNHGEKFWKLLNELTGGKAIELRDELKNYKTEI